ncbi:MAG: hypothetical protein QM706_14045 [Nitrospira sp.]
MAEKLSLGRAAEAQLRQNLLLKARTGDKHATQELQTIYNVRIWSDKERATLVYSTPEPKANRGKRTVRKS